MFLEINANFKQKTTVLLLNRKDVSSVRTGTLVRSSFIDFATGVTEKVSVPFIAEELITWDQPYSQLKSQLTPYQHAILIDLGRTFPNHRESLVLLVRNVVEPTHFCDLLYKRWHNHKQTNFTQCCVLFDLLCFHDKF